MLATTKYTPPQKNLESEIQYWISRITDTLIAHGFHGDIAERIACAGSKNLIHSIKRELFQTPVSFHLVPKGSEWAVISENGREIFFIDEDYCKVLAEARQLAKKNKIKLVLHSKEGWAKDSESFQVNRPFCN